MALFKRKPAETRVSGEPFTLTSGKLAIYASACPTDPRYEVLLEGEKDTIYLYGLDKESGSEPVDGCLIGRVVASGWTLVAPGFDGSPRWFPFTTSRCRFAWAPDRPKVWLVVDGVPLASFDFEAQRCWCASAFPHPSKWTRGPKDWNAEATEGWTA